MSACQQTEVRPAPAQWGGGVLALPDPFRLESGESLNQAQLAWQCVGPEQAPLVIVLGGISAHARCCAADGSGWWEAQCGTGKALDTSRLRLLGTDWLGGAGASSPASGVTISSADQARALLLLINRLGARRVHLLVGASYGGAVAQQLAALLGDRLHRLVLLCTAHRSSQFAIAFRHLQRALLELGQDSPTALALARSLAILGYVTPEQLERRFADGGDVVAWLARHGATFAQHFSANAYRCLGRSLDTHLIDPAVVNVPTTLFGVTEDLLVPPELLREYAARAPNCTLVESSSVHGHDAFLKEHVAVADVLHTALGGCP
ncbi:MAG: alpha/beta fold hydrolase [Proteobacteria bacterium]|nr:alpha/beta fold hydrolase [Pseudomonadota bacterium]